MLKNYNLNDNYFIYLFIYFLGSYLDDEYEAGGTKRKIKQLLACKEIVTTFKK